MKPAGSRVSLRRILLLLILVGGGPSLAYLLWSPGSEVTDGRHDLQRNGIWLQHGWLGDDHWFKSNNRDPSLFRSESRINALADLLARHGIRYVFPHLCPANFKGAIAPVDDLQTERLLDHFSGIRVIPWIGGVLDTHCSPESPEWRRAFISSAIDLLNKHPRLAGVQVNIEPMPDGNPHFLALLDEFRRALPAGKILSVAAYPPPTLLHPFPDVHWSETYFKEVAKRADQIVPMMYDTSISLPKLYEYSMAKWTTEILDWSGKTEVLLGLPAYGDAGVGYHDPKVENLRTALEGIHASLAPHGNLPQNYSGVAIYSEWEMNDAKWSDFKKYFEKK